MVCFNSIITFRCNEQRTAFYHALFNISNADKVTHYELRCTISHHCNLQNKMKEKCKSIPSKTSSENKYTPCFTIKNENVEPAIASKI